MKNMLEIIVICIAVLAAIIADTPLTTTVWKAPPPPIVTEKALPGDVPLLPQATCDEALRHQLINTTGASRKQDFAQLVAHVQINRADCRQQDWNPTPIRARTGDMCGNVHLPTNHLIKGKNIPRTFITRTGVFGETMPTYLTPWPSRDRANNIIIHWSNKPGQRPSNQANCWLYTSYDNSWTTE